MTKLTEFLLNKRRKKIMAIILAVVIILVAVALIIMPPSSGKMKPILDENGNVLEGSISEKTYVDINGTKLGMYIEGCDKTKPVLLFLGGGPGLPEYLLEKMYPTKLKEEFVVCYLEYRGTSLSYNKDIDPKTMTTDQYVDDVVSVTNYLKDRLNQDKIFLIAHSFGTYIGINTVKLHPELYYAYIPMSQMCSQKESELLAYDYMVDKYKEQGNDSKVKELLKYDIKNSQRDYDKYRISMVRDGGMHDLGIGTTHDMKSVITEILFPSLRCTVYSPSERLNIWRGKSFAQVTSVADGAWSFNAFDEVKELKLPVYFLAGEYDYTCCYSLQKQYYDELVAPHKEFYSFENPAHSPLFEENEKAMEIMVNIRDSYVSQII